MTQAAVAPEELDTATPSACIAADVVGSSALAALASVMRENGLQVSLTSLRKLAGLGAQGTDGVSMMYAAGKCGFDALPLEGEFDQLPELVLPGIAVFRDDSFQVLYAVDEASARVGDTLTGQVRRLGRDEFVAAWTGDLFQVTPNDGLGAAQERLRRQESSARWLAAMAGVAPVSLPRVLFVVAVMAWVALWFVAGPVAWLTGGCLLASLWMVAFPKGCSKCGATSSVIGKLPLAPAGVAFYGLLTGMAIYGGARPALSAGLLLASGAHLGLVGILLRKKIACYPCLATAAMAWTATLLTVRHVGWELCLLPASAAATLAAVHFAGKLARYEAATTMMTLAGDVMAEPFAPLPGGPERQARMVVYSRANCPICAYFKAVIRPVLEEEFGAALVLEERDAEKLNMRVPVFFVTGTARLALASVGTDEMLPRLGAAVQMALDPASGVLAELGGFQVSGFFEDSSGSAEKKI